MKILVTGTMIALTAIAICGKSGNSAACLALGAIAVALVLRK